MNEVVLRLEVLDDDRLGGLERAAGRRSQIGGQGRRADDAPLPAETCNDQQVGFPAAISEHFDMIDFHRPCDLHHDLVEKAVLIATFPRSPAHISPTRHLHGHRSPRGRVTRVTISVRASRTAATNSSRRAPAPTTSSRRTCRPTRRKTALDMVKPSWRQKRWTWWCVDG